jgi:disulfide bond formation protein DsbB
MGWERHYSDPFARVNLLARLQRIRLTARMPILIYTYSPRMVSWLLCITSATPLVAVLVTQYLFGFPPCELCVYQRYPYAFVLGLSIVAIVRPRYLKPVLLLSCAAFVLTASIGVFHVGVEQGWWQYGSACSTIHEGDGSLEGLRAAIDTAPLVSCDQSIFAFLDLSMAAWNVIAGLGLATLFGYMYSSITWRRYR